MSSISYITGDELANIMRSGKTPKKDYLVVDVRDDDYVGGNIVGGLNMPSKEFLMNVDQLVKETKDVPLVVFHCALSQLRGPKAARIYKETRQNVLSEIDSTSPTKVLVLRDGFTGFQAKFKDDAELVENWDKDVWASDWS
ncbi:Rhodanese-like domain-containing protein [Lentinula raphanica]|uniref:Rhodanese-like domain-containing protein n=1 Tax=Lentinula raphanica TaxID=153919 RepID=A0AA38P864_9AGAR|nr:Rhodanese-like domain-containing protein [Lentinula raphanica]KAJ3825298.1 Rhodanese-like domain-containing protein [Lentinula raphanica]KAJ3838089.1 Rhodanese-like domain-containing protein [Lentinula raphanica]KAJ3976352.1 Rhodanese-like domain-containing protein [Lentinula raphanica]